MTSRFSLCRQSINNIAQKHILHSMALFPQLFLEIFMFFCIKHVFVGLMLLHPGNFMFYFPSSTNIIVLKIIFISFDAKDKQSTIIETRERGEKIMKIMARKAPLIHFKIHCLMMSPNEKFAVSICLVIKVKQLSGNNMKNHF